MIETLISIGAIIFGVLLSVSHLFQLSKIIKFRKANQISKVFYGIILATLSFYALANLYRKDYFMFASFMTGLIPATAVFILSFIYGEKPLKKWNKKSRKK